MTAQFSASTTPAGTRTTTPAGTRTTGPDGRGLARRAWRRIGEVISDMNYAASRLAEPRVTGR